MHVKPRAGLLLMFPPFWTAPAPRREPGVGRQIQHHQLRDPATSAAARCGVLNRPAPSALPARASRRRAAAGRAERLDRTLHSPRALRSLPPAACQRRPPAPGFACSATTAAILRCNVSPRGVRRMVFVRRSLLGAAQDVAVAFERIEQPHQRRAFRSRAIPRGRSGAAAPETSRGAAAAARSLR